MLFPDYICNLAEALAAEDEERYREYLLAGGAPEDYHAIKPAESTANIQQDVERIMANMGGVFLKKHSDINEVAKVRRWERVFERDGQYYDEQGRVVKIPDGMYFVPAGSG